MKASAQRADALKIVFSLVGLFFFLVQDCVKKQEYPTNIVFVF